MVSTDWDGPFTETEAYFELCETGFDALAEGRLEDAMEVAQSLEDERASVGFELRAHVQLQGGDVHRAILALQEGTRRAKHNWVLWQLLGNCYSDLEQYDQADAAYESAARCENAAPDAVALNRAIMASRRQRPEAALAILDAHGIAIGRNSPGSGIAQTMCPKLCPRIDPVARTLAPAQ